jgi:lipopolysaccharide export system permease protein
LKILDRYLLKTFLTTLTTVFVILFFIFILQTVWLFISELAGKDLNFLMVVKFLLFSMPRIIPLVLPLSVLLASIMTFGDLAENYEFAAMKSSGISFQRTLKTLTVFIFILSIGAFIFANNVIPYAEYKFINFRKDIAQRTPAMAIAEGQFSNVGNYNIKVDKKSGENGNILTGITIHKKAIDGSGNKTVIKAKNGLLISSEDSNNLQLVLNNGYFYEDLIPKKYEERIRLPFAKSSFKKYVINMDLSKLTSSSFEQGEITNTDNMLNVRELKYTIDSLATNLKKDKISFGDNSYSRTGITTPSYYFINSKDSLVKNSNVKNPILKNYTTIQRKTILQVASSSVDNIIMSIESSKTEQEEKQKYINVHWIALYDKFVIAYACILMFFIGAPLGSIIRKGGLGLPIVFAVTIFIIFHFINSFGKRFASQNGMPPLLGTWMSSMVLTPLAILLTYRAINDIGGMISFDFSLIKDFFTNLFTSKAAKERQLGVSLDQNVKKEIPPLASEIEKYSNNSKFAIISFVAFVMMVLILLILPKTILFTGIASIFILAILLHYIYESQNNIEKIGTITNQKVVPQNALVVVLLFPIYILFYFRNKTFLKNLK